MIFFEQQAQINESSWKHFRERNWLALEQMRSVAIREEKESVVKWYDR